MRARKKTARCLLLFLLKLKIQNKRGKFSRNQTEKKGEAEFIKIE